MGTAGLARSAVSDKRRRPSPPARTTESTWGAGPRDEKRRCSMYEVDRLCAGLDKRAARSDNGAMRVRLMLYATALACALVGCALVGCKKSQPQGGGAAGGGSTEPAAAQTLPIGMADPFSPPKGDAAKLLETGYTGLRQKKGPVAVA